MGNYGCGRHRSVLYLDSDGDGRICTKSCRCIIYNDDEGFLAKWH